MHNLRIYHVFTACLLASTLFAGNTAAADAPTTSDFIDSLPALQPSTVVDGGYDWETADSTPSEYDRFLIEPIEIFIHSDSDYKGIDAVDLLTLTSTLRQYLIDALEPRYPVVNKPGPGVARMRIAITGVKFSKEKRKARGAFAILPIGLAANVAQAAVGRDVLLDGASMEMELLDSSTGKRLLVAIDSDALRHGKGKPDWESLDESFKLYASRIRQFMDESRKK